MSVVLVAPLRFSVVAANQRTIAPAINLNQDEPGMAYRSADLTTVYVKVQLDGSAWDTVALVGSNLRSGDTIRIRAGATSAAVDGTTGLSADLTFPAWSGSAPTNGALSFKLLGAAITSPFVRIDITSTGNPAGYVQASRLVLGKRVVTDGVSIGAKQSFEDMSVIEEGPGYTTIDEYGVRIGWKVNVEGITDAEYNTNWFPFLRAVGRKKGFVFIPDDTSPYVQTQAVYGRMNNVVSGESPVADYNIVEMSILSIS